MQNCPVYIHSYIYNFIVACCRRIEETLCIVNVYTLELRLVYQLFVVIRRVMSRGTQCFIITAMRPNIGNIGLRTRI